MHLSSKEGWHVFDDQRSRFELSHRFGNNLHQEIPRIITSRLGVVATASTASRRAHALARRTCRDQRRTLLTVEITPSFDYTGRCLSEVTVDSPRAGMIEQCHVQSKIYELGHHIESKPSCAISQIARSAIAEETDGPENSHHESDPRVWSYASRNFSCARRVPPRNSSQV